ncbi:hypothetical protein VTN96DRAFT_1481 [Rasamsonia emersonii]
MRRRRFHGRTRGEISQRNSKKRRDPLGRGGQHSWCKRESWGCCRARAVDGPSRRKLLLDRLSCVVVRESRRKSDWRDALQRAHSGRISDGGEGGWRHVTSTRHGLPEGCLAACMRQPPARITAQRTHAGGRGYASSGGGRLPRYDYLDYMLHPKTLARKTYSRRL